jgi:hypothetical protein
VLQALVAPVLLAGVTAGFCWKLLFGGLVVIGYDTMTYMFPYRAFAAEALRAGHLPLWNPHIFYGVPFLANLQSAVFYPLHVLFLLLPATDAMNWSVALHLFLCAWFAYLAARGILKVDRLSAVVAGTIYGLSGFVGAQVGHLNQLNAAAWLPLALLTLHKSLEWRSLRWCAATAAVLAVQLLAGHAQESYMTIVLLGGYATYHAIARTAAPLIARQSRLAIKTLLIELTWAAVALGLGGALAGGIAAVQLLPTNELTAYSIRATGMTFGEAASFSLPPRELFVGLLPTFGLAAPTSNEYLGWIGFGGLALVLFAALFRIQRPAVLFFFVLLVLSLMLALGDHFPLYAWAFKFPGMRLFRVPARWLMLATFAQAMLAGAGLAFVRQLGVRGWSGASAASAAANRIYGISESPAGPWQRLLASTRLLVALGVVALSGALLWPTQKPGPGTVPMLLLYVWLCGGAAAVALAFWSLAAAPSRWPATISPSCSSPAVIWNTTIPIRLRFTPPRDRSTMPCAPPPRPAIAWSALPPPAITLRTPSSLSPASSLFSVQTASLPR